MRLAAPTCALALALAPACTLHQAHATRQTAEVVTGSALAVMLVSLVAASVSPGHDALHDVGLACIPVTLLGAGTYIAADQRAGVPDEPVRARPRHIDAPLSERANQRARELAHEAAAAARAHDCDEVRTLEERIAQLDANVHAASLRHAKIRACLQPVPVPVPVPVPDL